MRVDGDALVLRQAAPWFDLGRSTKPTALFMADADVNMELKSRRSDLRSVRIYDENGSEFTAPLTDLSYLAVFGTPMLFDEGAIHLRLGGAMFERAARGWKPNELVVLTPRANFQAKSKRGSLRRIVVYNADDPGAELESVVTDMTNVAALGGGFFWAISWSPSEARTRRAQGQLPRFDSGVGYLWTVSWAPERSTPVRPGRRQESD